MTDQLPDESYIERLFPKCPPKQQYGGGTSWRPQANSRANGRQQQPKQHRRRAIRSKLQHSSRPDDSNDNATTTYSASANNTAGKQRQLQRANLSDSSDNDNVGSLKIKRGGHFKRSSSSIEVAGPEPASNGTRANSGNGKRRTSKYMASQSLLQQWQRAAQGHQSSANQSQPSLQAITSREAPPACKVSPASNSSAKHQETGPGTGPDSPPAQDVGRSLQKSKSTSGSLASASPNDTAVPVNRTSRGVVFGKPIDMMNDVLTSHQRQRLTRTGSEAANSQDDPSQPRTADASNTTTQARGSNDNKEVKSILSSSSNQLDGTNSNSNNPELRKHVEMGTAESVGSISQSAAEHKDNNENEKDKYIDLFVYDNAPSSSLEDRCLAVSCGADSGTPAEDKLAPKCTSRAVSFSIGELQARATATADATILRAPTREVNHLANHKLLTDFDQDEPGDESAIQRNDASAEELCNTSKSSDDMPSRADRSSVVVQDNKPTTPIEEDPGQTGKQTKVDCKSSSQHRLSAQPVEERAESNAAVDCCDTECKPAAHLDCRVGEPKLELLNTGQSEMQTSPNDSNNLIKKGFVPPGFAQRVSPNTHRMAAESTSSACAVGRTASEATTVKRAPPEKITADSKPACAPVERENLDNNENLISPSAACAATVDRPVESERSHVSVASCRLRGEHAPQMPSISEDQSECELQDAASTTGVRFDAELSSALNRMSLSSGCGKPAHKADELNRNEDTDETHYWTPQQTVQPVAASKVKTQLVDSDRNVPCAVPSETQSVASAARPSQKSVGQLVKADQAGDEFICLGAAQGLNLRHHRLPNETSHYSLVKASTSKTIPKAGRTAPTTSSGASTSVAIPKSSSTQFNTLSDNESGSDEQSNLAQSLSPPPSQATNKAKAAIDDEFIKPAERSGVSSSIKLDDDLAPTTKTALIFPRLDEGLSSEAESCEDDVEEEDDRAMEADVDADDDEDDDDDVEDEADSPTNLVDRALQASVDSYIRQQQQSQHQQTMRPQNRLVGSLQQQHAGNSTLAALDQTDMYSGKPASGYINQDSNEQMDPKTMSSYANQNGRGVHWMGLSSQQANVVPSQIAPSNQQQYSIQRNSHNGGNNANNLPRGGTNSADQGLENGSYGRDEAKAANRLSSDTDNETDRLLGPQRADQMQKLLNNDLTGGNSTSDIQINSYSKQNSNSREVLIEGVLFNVKYLGSTHTDCEGRGEKEDRIHQAEMAVHEVKFRNGEPQSATEVQLFVSTEKIMVLDDKHRKIMMDHSLRTISYIADIGDAIVLIVRKKNASVDATNELGRPISKISCHVFESSESHTITKSISQAFQVAYTELLKANGAADAASYLPKELDYQEVLNSQEMSTAELEMFARKDNQREVIVPKREGEILGLSIVESGWGSVLPTAVIASLKQDGPAYRCKKLSVGDQILSINGISLVGLSLPECQEILRKTKHQRVARLSVVPCPITVEVKIKRPDTKYQLGFSVQNGVICSLLRGGIAERGGVRVGHRIMSINGTTVVGVPHDKIVTLLASSVGEIRMKTCLTSLYRHMLGEEKAVFL